MMTTITAEVTGQHDTGDVRGDPVVDAWLAKVFA
jgi:hypothetical protein